MKQHQEQLIEQLKVDVHETLKDFDIASNQDNQHLPVPPRYKNQPGVPAPPLCQQLLATQQQNMLQPLQEITNRIDQLQT